MLLFFYKSEMKKNLLIKFLDQNLFSFLYLDWTITSDEARGPDFQWLSSEYSSNFTGNLAKLDENSTKTKNKGIS